MQASAIAALGVAVWMVYAADRLADAAASRSHGTNELLRFHIRHRRALLGMVGVAGAVALPLLVATPVPLRAAWLLLLVPLAVYAFRTHAMRRRFAGKSFAVAALFAIGTGMPVLTDRNSAQMHAVAAVLLLTGLCWINCLRIRDWHQRGKSKENATKYLTVIVAFSAVVTLPLLPFRICFAVLLALFGLEWLHRQGTRMLPLHRRALADVALLSPLLLWPVARH